MPLSPMGKLAWVSPEEKCVALCKKEHVKETCSLIFTPYRSLHALFSQRGRKEEAMEVLYERCCGLDVHKNTRRCLYHADPS